MSADKTANIFFLSHQGYSLKGNASRHLTAPEILVGHTMYGPGVDMWAVGCLLAAMLFRKEPFFNGWVVVDL